MSLSVKVLKSELQSGLTLADIARKYKLPNSTSVKRLIVKYDLLNYWDKLLLERQASESYRRKLSALRIKTRKEKTDKIHKERVLKIEKLIKEGKTKRDIKRILNISKSTIDVTIRKYLYKLWNRNKPDTYDIIGQGLKNTVGEKYINKLSYEQRKHLTYCWKLWKRKKAECRNRKLKFDIPFTLLYFPKYCPVTKEKLIYNIEKLSNNKATIDRIVPSKGYVLNNVKIISHKANRLKSNATIDDLERLLIYMKACRDKQVQFYYNPTLVTWRKLKNSQDRFGNSLKEGAITYFNRFE